MSADRIAGRVEFLINGRPYPMKANLKIDIGEPESEEVLDGRGKICGYKEVYRAASMVGTVVKSKNVSIKELASMSDATTVAETGDGTRYLFSESKQCGKCELDSESGEISDVIIKGTCTEIGS